MAFDFFCVLFFLLKLNMNAEFNRVVAGVGVLVFAVLLIFGFVGYPASLR